MDKSKKIIVNYKELVIIDLNESDVNLIRSSQKTLENSYSPYSGFKVGCSVLLSSGKVLCANNQENVAYPSGMCAERVALFYAFSKYPNSKILKIAVSARSDVFKIFDPVFGLFAFFGKLITMFFTFDFIFGKNTQNSI